MGRTYAGILGPLAFAVVLARGVIDASHVATTLTIATASLFLFAGIGYLVGRIADSIVLQNIKVQLDAEIEAREDAIDAN